MQLTVAYIQPFESAFVIEMQIQISVLDKYKTMKRSQHLFDNQDKNVKTFLFYFYPQYKHVYQTLPNLWIHNQIWTFLWIRRTDTHLQYKSLTLQQECSCCNRNIVRFFVFYATLDSLVMPKYEGKQKFRFRCIPKVGQKQWALKEEREKERVKVSVYNGQRR